MKTKYCNDCNSHHTSVNKFKKCIGKEKCTQGNSDHLVETKHSLEI